MLSIRTNLTSLLAQSSLRTSSNKLNQAIERMTTGFKINNAKDNAANYSISTNLSTKIGAYQVAEENTAMGLDMVTTASETLSLIEDKLSRLRALQEQASNGTYGQASLQAINQEVNAIVDEIERLYSTAEYNGLKLFGGSTGPTAQSTSNFLATVDYQTPEVTVSAPTQLADAIANNTIIGISNAETLAELATLVNSGTTCSGKTIVLMDDIDLSAYNTGEGWTPIGEYEIGEVARYFSGTFNGNGYVISNLYINSTASSVSKGLFGAVSGTVKNLGLEHVNINGNTEVGALAGFLYGNIINCYSNGSVVGRSFAGGLVGNGVGSISDSYTTGTVTATTRGAGGLIGCCPTMTITISNSYSSTTVNGGSETGGLAGELYNATITNSYATGAVTGTGSDTGGLVGSMSGSISDSYVTSDVSASNSTYVGAVAGSIGDSSTITNVTYYSSVNTGLSAVANNPGGVDLSGIVDGGTPPATGGGSGGTTDPTGPTDPDAGGGTGGGTGGSTGPTYAPDTIILQIGASSDWASQVGLGTTFALDGINDLRQIGLDTTTDYLAKIDDMLALVTAKQTHFGAVTNRLESVLEEITIQRENLVSSRSTLRDADISEVSSQYIQQQILQQASSTLLATANQSPDLALRLIMNSRI